MSLIMLFEELLNETGFTGPEAGQCMPPTTLSILLGGEVKSFNREVSNCLEDSSFLFSDMLTL